MESLIRAAFPEAGDAMVAIARCESGLNPNATGDLGLQFVEGGTTYGKSVGVMQVRLLPGRPTEAWLRDVRHNLEYARRLYDAHGLQPWSCAKKLQLL